jgi:adenylate cyclase
MSESTVPAEVEALWRHVLTEGHKSRWAFLPSSPRCAGCFEPFAGLGGRLMSLIGHRRSRKNPVFCNLCDDILPSGGAEVDIGVLFADVRGSTALAEKIGPRAFADTLNQFYAVATAVVIAHSAMLDKMVGDEVMALFIPSLCGGEHRRRAAECATTLSKAVQSVSVAGEVLPVGIGVHAGDAYVGKVGVPGTHDFTALGDTINAAARLQSEAAAGQVVVSATIYSAAPELFPGAEGREVLLRGRSEPLSVWVHDTSRRAAA